MRGWSRGWLLVAATALAAPGCGSDQPDDGYCTDVVRGASAVCVSDARKPPPASCDLVSNTGCELGEKCTFLDDPNDASDGYTLCAADGDVPAGGACAFGTDGIDDCAGGSWCRHGVCLSTCVPTPDSCPASDICRVGPDVLGPTEFGVCQPSCNPIASGCAANEGCYLSLTNGRSLCDRPADLQTTGPACEGAVGTQSCDCDQLNGCAAGYGCVLNNALMNATGLTCAFYCDPTNSGGPTCADGPGAGTDCRIIRDFYVNAELVPTSVGMCVDPLRYPCHGCIDETHPGCDAASCAD